MESDTNALAYPSAVTIAQQGCTMAARKARVAMTSRAMAVARMTRSFSFTRTITRE